MERISFVKIFTNYNDLLEVRTHKVILALGTEAIPTRHCQVSAGIHKKIFGHNDNFL